ncbi:oxidoreductase [Clostridium zeae]|uniref:Oxidoreductase n=1 Tax=Clostridium zeae TaxID=2759022 RepID=A0ABQ1EFF7_9CLOT|nr:NADH:flavin oxidoreductase [Clostridium zeae]GFZ33403.1 oxidoreductase [Clostridium zeae]
MKTLFDQTQFAGLTLKNRFVRSATNDKAADKEGHATEELLKIYENLAKGGVGTIITGLTRVSDFESLLPGQMSISNDSYIDEYIELTNRVHKYAANIILQLVCTGIQNPSIENGIAWGPSAVEDLYYKAIPMEMTKEDIYNMENAFAKGALRAKKAGFDGVQMHVAHGYLLSKFLNPYYNRRKDEYGGSPENRARAIIETYQKIRESVGKEFPVLIKINCDDFMDQGLSLEECLNVCKSLEKAGIDAIEISGGSPSSRLGEGVIRNIKPENESYFKQFSEVIAKELNIPLISVGGNRNFDKLTDIINETSIEYLSLSRPLIRESDLINRWNNGDRLPAKCISCSKCFSRGEDQTITKCIFNK